MDTLNILCLNNALSSSKLEEAALNIELSTMLPALSNSLVNLALMSVIVTYFS